MRADTLKNWLKDKGCRFDEHKHDRAEGHGSLAIKLGDKHSVLPLAGTHQDLDDNDVERVLSELGLTDKDLPQHTPGQDRKPGERHDRLPDREAKAEADAEHKARQGQK